MHALPWRHPTTHSRGSRTLPCAGLGLGTPRRRSSYRADLPVPQPSRSRGLVQKIGELAEAEGHHPDISFGWGYATVGLQTKKIKGLHENDFIMATKIDQIFDRSTKNPSR
jgi:hypothetical protein